MKTELKFTWDDNEEARDEMALINSRHKLHAALWAISQEIFRPARKHGYSDLKLAALLENTKILKDEDGDEYASGYEIIGLLEEKFWEILREYDIELD